MSNLIITIISIALVSIAAVMATYYGGVAYTNASVGAKANAIVNSGRQVATALQQWSINNGGANPTSTETTPYCNNVMPNFLVPTYLQSYSDIASLGTIRPGFPDKWFFVNFANGMYSSNCIGAITPTDTVRIAFDYSDEMVKICQQYNYILNNTTTIAYMPQFLSYCSYVDSNNNGTLDSGDYLNFVYRAL